MGAIVPYGESLYDKRRSPTRARRDACSCSAVDVEAIDGQALR